MDSHRIVGLALIGLGALVFVTMTTRVGAEVVVAGIGLGFLCFWVATRNYGLLIPGGILTGLGAGIVVESQGGRGGTVVIGLGLGFVAIAVIDALAGERRPGQWWPLIPGGVLTLVGASNLPGMRAIWPYLVPTALVAIGITLLVRSRGSTTA